MVDIICCVRLVSGTTNMCQVWLVVYMRQIHCSQRGIHSVLNGKSGVQFQLMSKLTSTIDIRKFTI